MEKPAFVYPAAGPALRGTLRTGTTSAPPPRRSTAEASAVAPPPPPANRDLTAAFAAAERQRQTAELSPPTPPASSPAQPADEAILPAAEASSPLPTAVVTRQDLTAAFAAAEQARLAAEAEEANRLPPAAQPAQEDADPAGPDYAALFRALLRGTGWGSEAGSGLSTSSAAAALLDWGEDNNAAHADPAELAGQIRLWVEGQDRCTQLDLRQNWPAVARHADELVQDLRPWAGRLADAGSPNRRTDYSPVHWAAVRQAVEQALNGV